MSKDDTEPGVGNGGSGLPHEAAAADTSAKDPFQTVKDDPWTKDANPMAPVAQQDAKGKWQPYSSFSGGSGMDGGTGYAGPLRFVLDTPPSWDGKDPEKMTEPFLKRLKGWMATTRTAPEQRGWLMLDQCRGDLYTIVNELTPDDLGDAKSADKAVSYTHLTLPTNREV